MALSSGSVSLVRYQVLGAKKNLALADMHAGFMANRAGRLRLSGVSREESVGWIRPTIFDDEVSDGPPDQDNWDLSSCRVGDGLLLYFRIERRRVPTALLQNIVRGKIWRIQERGRTKPVTAKERRQILLETKHELTMQALPELKIVESYWSLASGQIFLSATSKKVQQHFEKLFFESFGKPLTLHLIKVDPPLMGIDAAAWLEPDKLQKHLSTFAETMPLPLAATAQQPQQHAN